MNKETRDFTLLHPFDLEAANAGALVCWYSDGRTLKYVGPSTRDTAGCFEWLEGEHKGTFETYSYKNLRMAPICWVEGRPVYRGDKLWHTGVRKVIEVEGEALPSSFDAPCIKRRGFEDVGYYISFLTWNTPKLKKEGWVNIYPGMRISNTVHTTKELANKFCDEDRVACIRIEWEE